jgi:signal transduction histidine kinase
MASTCKTRVPEIVRTHEQEILADWIARQLESAATRRDLISEAELQRQSRDFLAGFVKAAESGVDVHTPPWKPVLELISRISASRAALGFSPSETATFVLSLKQPMFTQLRRSVTDAGMLADETWVATLVIDALGLHATETYQRAREEIINRQQQRVRQAEAKLAAALEGERRARQIAEQASRLKDEFIATLSHELRTPLNALMGWIWQLRYTPLGDAARERALDSLERNARMQAQLINDLLDVSRASKGKLQLEMRLVNLKAIVATATEFIREAMERQQLELRQQVTPVWVAGDEARLQQIVTNLLTNAVQFTPRNGRVSITLSADGEDAVLAVQDTGAGIDPAFVPYIFDQFRQGEGALSRKHGGLGLGLTVVKQLVDLHNGVVTVTSPGLGQGTTFTVRLPRETELAHEGTSGNQLLLQDVRILLLATESVATSTLRSVLESSGARVTIAGSLEESEHLPDSDVDLIVRELNGEGGLTLQFPGVPPSLTASHSIPRSAATSDIVRRIARTITSSKAR